jgi:hypothetical protein
LTLAERFVGVDWRPRVPWNSLLLERFDLLQ